VKLIRRIYFIGQTQHCVLKREKSSRIDVEFNVKIDWTAAPIFWVKVNFPRLTQRVSLDEVPFIVHVEAVSNRVVFQVCDETSNINGGHYLSG
jgi:hypothetical protein